MTIDTISDPDLAALRACWSGKCNDRAMPSRADINPNEIRLLLPDIFIMDIHRPQRFPLRFRLVGNANSRAVACER